MPASAVISSAPLAAVTVASEVAAVAETAIVASAPTKITPPPVTPTLPIKSIATGEDTVLFEQRIAATKLMLSKSPVGSASIQLFYTNDVRPTRIERFLQRAEELGKLNEIYVLPIKINGKQGLRILYGIFPNSRGARSGMQQLPKRYLDAYAPSIFLLEDYPA
jgi:hypothetical protein